MSQEEVVEIFLDYEDYFVIFEKNNEDLLFYIFTEEIGMLSGEKEFLTHHEYSVNYKEKFCIFNDFYINYETGEKNYTNYKIVLKLRPELIIKKLKKQTRRDMKRVKFVVKIIMNLFFATRALIKHVKIVLKNF